MGFPCCPNVDRINVRAAEAAADIQQVWANCAAFNEDGSGMFEAGAAGEAELSGLFVAAGLPTPADALSAAIGGGSGRGSRSSRKPPRGGQQQPQHHDTAEDHAAADMLAALGSPRQQEAEVMAPRRRKRPREEAAEEGLTSDDGGGASPTARTAGSGGTKRQRQAAGDAAVAFTTAAAATAAVAAATAAHYATGQPAAATANEPLSGEQAAAACKAVLAVAAQPAGTVFAAPVGKEAPSYRREIKRPMDLGTISQRLQQGAYKTMGAHSFELKASSRAALQRSWYPLSHDFSADPEWQWLEGSIRSHPHTLVVRVHLVVWVHGVPYCFQFVCWILWLLD